METSERKRVAKAILWTVVITLVVVLVAVLVVPFTGAIDVAATEPHLPGVHWYLETIQARSVAAAAEGIELPTDLASPQRVTRGLVAYHEMCVVCHGAPGVEPGWMGQGLNPEPPALWEEGEREITEAQAARDYRVIEHGIRMTGMPALAPSHGEEEIWDLVAFLQHVPGMSAEAYASSVEEAGLSLTTEHEHGPGGHGPGDETAPDEGSPPGEEGEDHHHDDGHEHS
ncbi:MAG TPA: cytochrome c [Thermoanaerobaculia bacterium]